MTPRTVDGSSTPDAQSTIVVTEESSATRRELLGQAFLEGVWFDGGREVPFNVRNYFLPRPRYRQSFANIPAFRMWADREESDEELLRQLGSQWGGGELE